MPGQGTPDTVTPDWRREVAGRSGRTVRGRGPALAERRAGLPQLTAGTPGERGGARADLREGLGPGACLRVSISNPEPRSIRGVNGVAVPGPPHSFAGLPAAASSPRGRPVPVATPVASGTRPASSNLQTGVARSGGRRAGRRPVTSHPVCILRPSLRHI